MKDKTPVKVYLVREARIGSFPPTWGLWRVGSGPGRGEGVGFLTIKAAEEFAKVFCLTIVKSEGRGGPRT